MSKNSTGASGLQMVVNEFGVECSRVNLLELDPQPLDETDTCHLLWTDQISCQRLEINAVNITVVRENHSPRKRDHRSTDIRLSWLLALGTSGSTA